MRVSEIRVKQIRVNQGLGVPLISGSFRTILRFYRSLSKTQSITHFWIVCTFNLYFQFWHSWKRNWIWQTSIVYYYILRRFNNCKFTYIPNIFHIFGSNFQNWILQFNLPMHYVWFLLWDSTKKKDRRFFTPTVDCCPSKSLKQCFGL